MFNVVTEGNFVNMQMSVLLRLLFILPKQHIVFHKQEKQNKCFTEATAVQVMNGLL